MRMFFKSKTTLKNHACKCHTHQFSSDEKPCCVDPKQYLLIFGFGNACLESSHSFFAYNFKWLWHIRYSDAGTCFPQGKRGKCPGPQWNEGPQINYPLK